MLLFGHAGLTTLTVAAGEAIISKKSKGRESLSLKVDYRLVIIGSLLPDLLDKPLWLLGSVFPSGRAYAHTLLFSLALILAGIVLLKFRKNWLFILGTGSLLHLVFDGLWQSLPVLLYPLYGQIPLLDTEGWMQHIFNALTRPSVNVPEVIGAGVLVVILLRLAARKRIGRFLTAGSI